MNLEDIVASTEKLQSAPYMLIAENTSTNISNIKY